MLQTEFEKSIKKLSLQSCIILIGLLSQRSMDLFTEQNKALAELAKPSTLILPQK